jgi:hypothetical protein
MIRPVGIPSRFRRFGTRSRTEIFELLNPTTRGKRWGDWRLIFIAEGSGLLRRLERHSRHAEIRAGRPIRDPAPLAMVPLRGLMVTAARAMPIFVVKSAR